ncbi:hypothetical protein LCGC14_1957840, partial [marine sediment metagenome]
SLHGEKEKYMKRYKCPKCKSTNYSSTCMGFMGDRDENEIRCFNCGWKGFTFELDGYTGSLIEGPFSKKNYKR